VRHGLFFLVVSVLGAALPAMANAQAASTGSGQAYPSRPVRVLVGLAPGGGTDTYARLISGKLTDTTGQQFIVDNRPSAGGNVAGETVARALPDGYTLWVATPTSVINPHLFSSVRYDILKDFAPVVQLVNSQFVLSVRTSVPVNSVQELITMAKAQPGKLSYASSGIGSSNHLAGELFKSMAGINLAHVPYKGAGPALNAVLAGEVGVIFSSSASVIGHAKAGRVRILGMTGVKRTPIAPDIPTIAEAGVPGYSVLGWYGIVAPAKTPKAVIEKLNADVNKALPELRERYAALGADIAGGTAAEFGAFIKAEHEKWAKVVKIAGAKVE
jgi:tripartite-type tricarboxylate transporter receptor subunit TctC